MIRSWFLVGRIRWKPSAAAISQALQQISAAAWREKNQSLKETERLMKDISPKYSCMLVPDVFLKTPRERGVK